MNTKRETAVVICGRRIALALVAVVISLLLATPAQAQRQTEADRRRTQFHKRRSDMMLNLRHELSQLSEQCHEQGLAQAAQDLTQISLDLTAPSSSNRLPDMAQLPMRTGRPAPEQLWRNRLKTLRNDKATELYILARRALGARLPTVAYSLIQDVLRMDPDHAKSRAVLGQELFRDPQRKDDPTYAGEWVSPFEARKRKSSIPEINHPEFGWIRTSHVDRYESGQRPWRGTWISPEKESEIRRNFNNAWEVRSEHFLIKTNTSLEEGVQISQQLEIFHSWLQTNFAAFFETPAALAKRFEQASIRRRATNVPPMKVHYYAERDEYDRRMRGKIPANIVTNGFYSEDDRTCYFFRNPDADGMATVFHEATHQILDMATVRDRQNASKKRQRVLRHRRAVPWKLCGTSNFWLIEGLACYFESFRISEGAVSVGDTKYTRFNAAQQRLLRDNFYVPLQPFCSLGQQQFQTHPNIAQLYSQASGVAHFLLHYKDGIYRDDFVTLLAGVYRPDLKNVMQDPALDRITGVKFANLDQQYREHLENIAIEQRAAAKPMQQRNAAATFQQ